MREALLVTLFLALVFWISSDSAQTTNCTISGGTNYGLQIQNCDIVQQVVTPTFHLVKEFPVKKNDDGTYTRSAIIEIDAPYVPGNMLVLAKGPTVVDLRVNNGGAMIAGNGKFDSGVFWFQVATPWDKYTIDVKTSDRDTPVATQVMFNHRNPD